MTFAANTARTNACAKGPALVEDNTILQENTFKSQMPISFQ